jgi:hypothetical protein
MKNKKELLGNLKYAVAGGLLGLICIILPNNTLKPRDFDNANWIKYDNPSGGIYSCYENEVGSLNLHNWQMYMDEVREKNNYNLEGKIWLPDLDGDGKVRK